MYLYIQSYLLPYRQTCRVCKGYRDDSELHRNVGSQMQQLRAVVYGNRKKERKQQHINGTLYILLKGCTTKGVRSYDQKSSSRLDSHSSWTSLHSERVLACYVSLYYR
ncbi:hypothetical protein TNCV_2109501 [Trichonephila clavipes]|nr:hypothetical protein TNCV_2109501 [Trichonephila clavipes]